MVDGCSYAEAETPPGPGRNPVRLLGLGRQWMEGDPVDVLEYLRERYGRTVRFYHPGFGGEGYVLSRPEDVQHVLNDSHDSFAKAEIYEDELADVFGKGLVTSEGDLWRRQRRLIAPMFTRDQITEFVEVMVEETESMIERWRRRQEDGETIDLLEETERVTLQVIGRTMFGEDMEGRADRMQWSLDRLRRRFKRRTEYLVKVPDWMPTPLNSRDQRAFEALEEVVWDIIEGRCVEEAEAAVEEGDADLLDMLLAAETDDGERMTEQQVRDEVVTFLLAGHETTAASLAWTWYLLSHNPEKYRSLYHTVEDADVDDDAPAVAEELRSVRPYVQEGMRVFPPVPMFARRTLEDQQVGRYHVPEDSLVVLPQVLTHRDPDIWRQPWRYDPDRFRGAVDDRPDYSYYPFGGGPRMCIGRTLSLVESQIVLGLTTRELRLELESPTCPPHEIPVRSAVTLTPTPTIEMSVREWE